MANYDRSHGTFGASARALVHQVDPAVFMEQSSAAAFHRFGREVEIAHGGNEREQAERECVVWHHLDGEQGDGDHVRGARVVQ